MSVSASEQLKRFYSQFKSDDKVLVVINADPDAIACAMSVKRLLWRRTAGVVIAIINIIQRADNLAMVKLLDVNLTHIDQLDPTRFSRFVLTDSQPNHNEIFARFTFDVVIDHHPDTGINIPFRDIRPKYGATATILTEYLRAAKIKPSVKLATGLFYAIKTDTSNFERQTLIEDLEAFQFLFRHSNVHMIRKIESAELRPELLRYFKRALNSMKKRENRIFSHLGTVPNPDVCVIIADFFVRVQSIDWSFISGVYGNRLIIIFRNDGLRRNAGKVAKESFGSIGSAGGHKSMARAEIPLDAVQNLCGGPDDRKLLQWIIQHIQKRAGKK